MSQRQIKKQRQFLRREFADQYKQTATMLAESDRQFLKPKPKWIPLSLWVMGLRIFVRIK